MLKDQTRGYFDYKEAPKDSVAPSDNIEKIKEDFLAPSSEIYKTTKIIYQDTEGDQYINFK